MTSDLLAAAVIASVHNQGQGGVPLVVLLSQTDWTYNPVDGWIPLNKMGYGQTQGQLISAIRTVLAPRILAPLRSIGNQIPLNMCGIAYPLQHNGALVITNIPGQHPVTERGLVLVRGEQGIMVYAERFAPTPVPNARYVWLGEAETGFLVPEIPRGFLGGLSRRYSKPEHRVSILLQSFPELTLLTPAELQQFLNSLGNF